MPVAALATIAELVLVISGNTYREGRKLNLASAEFVLPPAAAAGLATRCSLRYAW